MQNDLCMPPVFITDEKALTEQTFIDEYLQFERMALVACKWDNLPNGVTQRWIERFLFYFGNCVFFYDSIMDKYFTFPLAGILTFDEYGDPETYTVMGWGAATWNLDKTNSVIIWNNYEHVSSSGMAQRFATRTTNALRTGDVHLEAHKIGKIISVPAIQKRGVQKILERIKDFVLYTIVSPNAITQGNITEINGQPEDYVLDKIDNHYSFLVHRALSYFGVDSISDKKSGMTDREQEAEMSGANTNKQAILLPRKEACVAINDMFGLSLSVSIGADEYRKEMESGYGGIYDNAENSPGSGNGEDETS